MKNIKTYEEYTGRTLKDFLKKYHENEDYSKMTDLFCSLGGLIDLNGIGEFKNLENIDCFDNYISSLKEISNLTKLIGINFHHNNLTSLKGIENLTKLVILYCQYNKITSLEPIKNLTKLMDLICDDNEITSLKGIENLTKLRILYCQSNPIDWVDYIDKQGNIWYTVLPKSIDSLRSDKFRSIEDYWKFMDKNQPASVSRKFNF